MNTLVSILVVALFIGSLYRRMKRLSAQPVGEPEPSAPMADGWMSDVESDDIRAPFQGEPVQQKRAEHPTETIAEPQPVAFDLRQAVIYQTILHNEYI